MFFGFTVIIFFFMRKAIIQQKNFCTQSEYFATNCLFCFINFHMFFFGFTVNISFLCKKQLFSRKCIDAEVFHLNKLYRWLLNKPYENEATLREKNPHLKCCKPLKIYMHIEKSFRSFIAGNMGSVGWRAAKLLTVKVGVLKKKSAASAITVKVCASPS